MSLDTRLATLISAIGADIKALQASSGGASTLFDEMRSTFKMTDDFLNAPTPFQTSVGGTAAAITYPTPPQDGTVAGVAKIDIGTATSGAFAGLLTPADALLLGRGRARFITRVFIPILSTSANRFSLTCGFSDAIGFGTDQVVIAYEESASTFWRIKTVNNFSASTIINTSVSVVANTWYTLAIEVNAEGTNADFYINNVLVGSITTNIPVGAGRYTGAMVSAAKLFSTDGTLARSVLCDYFGVEQKFTTLR